MSSLDPTLSEPPSDDELAQRLEIAVPELESETARTVVMALQGLGPDDYRTRSDSFRRQLGYRLEQARHRSER